MSHTARCTLWPDDAVIAKQIAEKSHFPGWFGTHVPHASGHGPHTCTVELMWGASTQCSRRWATSFMHWRGRETCIGMDNAREVSVVLIRWKYQKLFLGGATVRIQSLQAEPDQKEASHLLRRTTSCSLRINVKGATTQLMILSTNVVSVRRHKQLQKTTHFTQDGVNGL